jgi:hypothetical protein
MTSELQALADRQWRDYRGREPGTCFSDLGFTLDLARAYELQDAVTALRIFAGDRLVGYKVGCTGAGTVQQFGMEGRSAAASSKVKCGDTARRWISMTSQVWRSKARWPCGWGQMARSRLSSPSSSCTTSSSGGSGRPSASSSLTTDSMAASLLLVVSIEAGHRPVNRPGIGSRGSHQHSLR